MTTRGDLVKKGIKKVTGFKGIQFKLFGITWTIEPDVNININGGDIKVDKAGFKVKG